MTIPEIADLTDPTKTPNPTKFCFSRPQPSLSRGQRRDSNMKSTGLLVVSVALKSGSVVPFYELGCSAVKGPQQELLQYL